MVPYPLEQLCKMTYDIGFTVYIGIYHVQELAMVITFTMYVLNVCRAICLLYGLNVAFSFIDGLCIKCFHLTIIVDIFGLRPCCE